MRRRISCSRAASKYCWGVKYGMAFFWGEDTVDGGWVSSPKRAVCGFLGGDFGDGFWGCGLGGMEENKKSGGGDVRAKALSWDDEWDKA